MTELEIMQHAKDYLDKLAKGIDPLTGEKVYTAKSYEEKLMQRSLMQYWLPKNQEIVRKALRLAHREDLIGFDRKCLVRPEGSERRNQAGGQQASHRKKKRNDNRQPAGKNKQKTREKRVRR